MSGSEKEIGRTEAAASPFYHQRTLPRNDWLLPLGIAVTLHLAAVAAGFLSHHDHLLDLINAGEMEAVAPADPVADATSEVTLVDLTPAPPAEADPAFVVPQEEEAPALPADPPPSKDSEEPLPPVSSPPSAPALVAEPPPPAAPVSPSATANSAPAPAVNPAPAETYASSGVVIGNHDFPKPPYPYDAKRKGYQGTVVVSLNIVDGAIVDAQIASSSGYGTLDAAARNWIRKNWHFPAEVTRSLNQPICFELADKV